VSTTLMTSLVLTPAFKHYEAECQQDPSQPRLRFDLKVSSSQTLSDVIESIHKQTLDAAIVWRPNSKQFGKSFEKYIVEDLLALDLVVVSWDKQLINRLVRPHATETGRYDVIWEEVIKNRIVTVAPVSQPFADELGLVDYGEGGARTEVDTFEAALACVRARVADLAIIPAVYPALERFAREGALCFSPKIGDTAMVLLARNEKLKRNKSFLDFRFSLRNYFSLNQWRFHASEKPLPSPMKVDAKFITDLKHGYYIEIDQELNRTVWQSESLQLELDVCESQGCRFKGKITNEETETFSVQAELLEEVFVIVSKLTITEEKRKQNQGKRKSVKEFVSVFSQCWPDDGVIYGSWFGWSRSFGDQLPVNFGTIYSSQKLDSQKIENYCRQGEMAVARAVECSHKFKQYSRWPENKTWFDVVSQIDEATPLVEPDEKAPTPQRGA
jgi:hypothetical protein